MSTIKQPNFFVFFVICTTIVEIARGLRRNFPAVMFNIPDFPALGLFRILAALSRRRGGSGFGSQLQNPPQHGNGQIKSDKEHSPLLSSFPAFLSNKSSCCLGPAV
jgi:hypothetical protein